jgi:hypothetical protein
MDGITNNGQWSKKVERFWLFDENSRPMTDGGESALDARANCALVLGLRTVSTLHFE